MRFEEERYADLERPAVGCVWQVPFVVVAYIAHPKGEMTNWWRFLGDWDGAFKEKYSLWKIK